MNELQIFSNNQFGEVRTTIVNGEPYFMLSDVCRVLEINNPSQAKSRLSQYGVITNEVIDSMNRKQTSTFINESNLYKLVFQSRKPQAEKFSEWVTGEVLPSIRQTGSYSVKALSPAEQLLAQAQLMVEMENRVTETEQGIKRLEHNIRRNVTSNHLTVIAYANLNSISPKRYNPSVIGRKASAMCRNEGILVGKIVDSKYGYINTYPTEILDKVFTDQGI